MSAAQLRAVEPGAAPDGGPHLWRRRSACARRYNAGRFLRPFTRGSLLPVPVASRIGTWRLVRERVAPVAASSLFRQATAHLDGLLGQLLGPVGGQHSALECRAGLGDPPLELSPGSGPTDPVMQLEHQVAFLPIAVAPVAAAPTAGTRFVGTGGHVGLLGIGGVAQGRGSARPWKLTWGPGTGRAPTFSARTEVPPQSLGPGVRRPSAGSPTEAGPADFGRWDAG